MATPIGTNIVTSISRRYILPQIIDAIYRSNPVFFRINAASKQMVQGGTQIEIPVMYQRFTNGGPYQGYDLLDVAPNDTVKSLAFDWKQQYVPVSVDRLTLIKWNSPDAVANGVGLLFAQAEMEMAERLATGLWSDATTDPKQIDGIQGAIDDGGVATTYGGLTRSSNTWLNSTDDSTTATLTWTAMQSHFMSVTEGGRSPSLIASRSEQYVRYLNLAATGISGAGGQSFPVQAGGHDEQLASAGFTNALFNNVPWVVDSHVFDGPNASNSAIVFMNEDYFHWVVTPLADFYLEDFQIPVNQDAMVAKILWAGNFAISNTKRQGKMTNISG